MRKIIVALLVCFLLIACQPVEKTPDVKKEEPPAQPKVQAEEKVVEPTPQVKEEKAPVKAAPAEVKVKDLRQDCSKILPVEEFSKICDLDPARMTGTVKETENTCWVTFVDRMDRKYTAGFTIVNWLEEDEANSELDRGLNMRRMEAETDIGERNYKYPEINRENVIFVRGSYLTRIGASTELCTKEQLAELAKKVDAALS